MPDREKVIKGLKELEGFLFKEYTNIKAEESKIYYDRFKSLSDAIDLLKEQEPTTVKPHYIDKYSKLFVCGFECGSCHKEISGTYHYCPHCGRQVKWNA